MKIWIKFGNVEKHRFISASDISDRLFTCFNNSTFEINNSKRSESGDWGQLKSAFTFLLETICFAVRCYSSLRVMAEFTRPMANGNFCV
jgi:hypothetical protein